ncbi:hypothetical protein SAMN05892877_117148 [Rhizobium subbaraonis]|uniref:Uncharacterized protein n=1 Tax=Rhizobium subbaraonis TaxID=908946 RepID=A0A285UVC5_9HYPH|nr:hypothetical protein SAMN05892877_117148 [Rhizobium subbaraonis]
MRRGLIRHNVLGNVVGNLDAVEIDEERHDPHRVCALEFGEILWFDTHGAILPRLWTMTEAMPTMYKPTAETQSMRKRARGSRIVTSSQ